MIFKRLHHTYTFSKDFFPWFSTEPKEGLRVPPRPVVVWFFLPIYTKRRFFSFLASLDIHKCFSKSLCLLLVFHLIFRRLRKLFYQLNIHQKLFSKFSLTQTNRKCKGFHFTWLCKI